MQDKEGYLDVALDIILNRLDIEKSKKYIGFYESISNESLKKIFSIYHNEINDLFEYLNSRLINGHFTAHESRQLINLIKQIENISTKLKDTKLEFEVREYYKKVLGQCKNFLQSSNGSPIPKDFKRIEIEEFAPIFILKEHIEVQRGENNSSYELKLIGRGSYANVYRYKDKYYNKNFVVKKAFKDLREDEYERFKLEYEETRQLKSPYIIEVYNFNNDKKEYTMEYMDMSLEEYILKNNNKLTIRERSSIVGQILKAFTYIHSKGRLHRDISTKNTLIKIYEDVVIAKISDFGLVKVPKSDLTREGTEIKGSLNDHKHLEIIGFKNYSITHETYALTKLIYFIMTGKTSLERYDKGPYKEFVKKGIADNLDMRYLNIQELKQAFNKVIKELNK